jgi:hypothetical protein
MSFNKNKKDNKINIGLHSFCVYFSFNKKKLTNEENEYLKKIECFYKKHKKSKFIFYQIFN